MKAKNNSFSAKITVDLPKMRQTLGKSPINSRIKGKNDQIPKKNRVVRGRTPNQKKKKEKGHKNFEGRPTRQAQRQSTYNKRVLKVTRDESNTSKFFAPVTELSLFSIAGFLSISLGENE